MAIAIFGVVVLQTFRRSLERRLVSIDVSQDVRHSVSDQSVRLAGLELPTNLPPVAKNQLATAVSDAFIAGFRVIMLTGAVLALGSAFSAWLLIEKRRGD